MSPGTGTQVQPELLRRVRDGDVAAFRELVRRIHPLVHRWATTRTADPDLADDVTQEVLVRVHRRLDEFRGDSRFTTWLYRLTANAASDQLRRAGRQRRLAARLLSAVARADHAAAAPADAGPDGERIRLLVARFAQALPDRQRQLFDLVDLQGFEPTEAAAMLGLSGSTARVHLHRARRALRAAILEDAPEIARDYGGST